VEPLISASIVLVALQNIFRPGSECCSAARARSLLVARFLTRKHRTRCFADASGRLGENAGIGEQAFHVRLRAAVLKS